MWGRLDMEGITFTYVVYWRIRTIYRRETARFITQRNAHRFCNWSRNQRCVRSTRAGWFGLVVAGGNIRTNGELIRAVTSTGRRCHGFRTSTLFPIKTDRNRQSRTNQITRSTASISEHFKSSRGLGSQRPFRIAQSFDMEGCAGGKTLFAQTNHVTCPQAWGSFKRRAA